MEIIDRYFPELTRNQRKQYLQLSQIYNEWNRKVNVISRKDIEHLYLKHILHSMAIGRYVRFRDDAKILDVGTGGGFPGIPLAILFPQTEFLLVDSIRKKIRVVDSVIDALELSNCRALPVRAEQVTGQFDFIVSRAVTSLPVFIKWVDHLILREGHHPVPNGILALKGGQLGQELNIPQRIKLIDLTEYFNEPFFETKKLVHVEC
jgi:16S rRNA (guanine527-N7)-methyltransferase